MSTDRPCPPDSSKATTTAEFVASLARLRRWAGDPSLSRLRSLGGRRVSPDGATVDALPKSTISHVLRETGKLPRWDFVQAFVTACLRYCDYPAELIADELEGWRAVRATLAGSGTSTPNPPGAEARASPIAATEALAEVPARTRPAGSPESSPAAVAEVPAGGTAARAEAIGRSEPDQAVELLARRVAREEDRARKGLLGGYSVAPVPFGPQANPGRLDGTGDVSGDLHTIGRFFSELRPQRLLVIGESGAGKTVLAIELVLQLLEHFLTVGGGRPGHRQMVPVRLSAARWTSGSPFEPWLAEQLVQDFGLTNRDAERLVRDRLVLPVVDGLDELDPEPATGPPRRAIGLLAELNRYSDLSGRRSGAVVVTCRAGRHAELSAERVGLDGATRVHLHDLTIEQISAYLHARWPDGHPCVTHRNKILRAMSGPSGAAVHAALATPWRLLLVATDVESGAEPRRTAPRRSGRRPP